jgi:initiation factor 1A
MVKNTGGNKAKGFARKHVNTTKTNDIRVAEEEGEIYAVVTSMCGGNMFQCYCIDGIERLCRIRGSFSGRKKRDNIVEKGGWVLIGTREWDNSNETKTSNTKKVKLQQCDLLEVYAEGDKEKLKETVKLNWKRLISHDPTKIDDENDDNMDDLLDDEEAEDLLGFKFSTINEIEREQLLKEAQSATSEKIKMSNTNTEEAVVEEMVSFDDI